MGEIVADVDEVEPVEVDAVDHDERLPVPEFLGQVRAADYTARFMAELAARHLDRALLAGFAELVRAARPAPIADIGSGSFTAC